MPIRSTSRFGSTPPNRSNYDKRAWANAMRTSRARPTTTKPMAAQVDRAQPWRRRHLSRAKPGLETAGVPRLRLSRSQPTTAECERARCKHDAGNDSDALRAEIGRAASAGQILFERRSTAKRHSESALSNFVATLSSIMQSIVDIASHMPYISVMLQRIYVHTMKGNPCQARKTYA